MYTVGQKFRVSRLFVPVLSSLDRRSIYDANIDGNFMILISVRWYFHRWNEQLSNVHENNFSSRLNIQVLL